MSAPSKKPVDPPAPPIDDAACTALVHTALLKARAKAIALAATPASPSDPPSRVGVTIDLSHHKIARLPVEVIDLIRDEIERLALAHNQITGFPGEFAGLPRLRYLNLRSNWLRELPLALTRLPSLEILDVSRNRLRALPADLGNLMGLKVLSMSKNKIAELPTYIGDMNDLKILKLDNNPIRFPPKEVWNTDEKDRDLWLRNVKGFLRQHAERAQQQVQDTESTGGSSDGDNDNELYNAISQTPSFEPDLNTIRPQRPSGIADSTNVDRSHSSSSSLTTPLNIRAKPSGAPAAASEPSISSPGRDNSMLNTRRQAMLPPRRPAPNTSPPRPVSNHTRGLSHDSQIHAAAAHPRSPSSPAPRRRFVLSSLPEHKRSSLSSARVGEAARGILYAMSTLQHPLEQYVSSTDASSGDDSPHAKVERALYNANIHINSLITALVAYEERDDDAAVKKVIDSCHSCVAAFRQVLAMLQQSMRELSGGEEPDIRYCRTLLLMLYGSYVEIQSSYEKLTPLLISRTLSSAKTSRRTHTLTSFDAAPTPRSADSFAPQHTPMSSYSSHLTSNLNSFDPDDSLMAKFNNATSAAISTLPAIAADVQSTATQNLQPHITLKLREVSMLCANGIDAARRLQKTRWDLIQSGDLPEKRRSWEEANKFTQVIINMAELMKSIIKTTHLPAHTRTHISTVLRPTKDLYILVASSSLRPSDTPNGMHTPLFPMMPATPMSAALGPAAQATMPYGYNESLGTPLGMGGFSAASSRAGTMLSANGGWTPGESGSGGGSGGGGVGGGSYSAARSPGRREDGF